MTQNIYNPLFFSLDGDVQKLILMHLPFHELADSVSLVCKAFFQRSQEAVPAKALESIKSLKYIPLADRACTMVLKVCKNMFYYQKLDIIQAITDPHVRFNQCMFILPACPQAQKLAEETALSIEDNNQRYTALLRLYKATKSIEHRTMAKTHISKSSEEFLHGIKLLKATLNICKSDEDTVVSINNTALDRIKQCFTSTKLGLDDKICYILKLADLTFNPEDHLRLATKLNEQLAQSDEDAYAENILKIELAYLKYNPNPLPTSTRLAICKKIIAIFLGTGCAFAEEYIFDKAKQRDLNLARMLVPLVHNTYKTGHLLSILEQSKEISDLKKMTKVEAMDPDTASGAIKIALCDFKDVTIARKIGNLIYRYDEEDDVNFYRCVAFSEIFNITKDSKDLEQSDQFMRLINDKCLKIEALTGLFKVTKNNNYQNLGVELHHAVDYLEPGDRVRCLSKLSILSNDFKYLEQAFVTMLAFEVRSKPQIFEIFLACIDHFKNYEKACIFLQRSNMLTTGPDHKDIYLYVFNKLILQKRFDLAQLILPHYSISFE